MNGAAHRPGPPRSASGGAPGPCPGRFRDSAACRSRGRGAVSHFVDDFEALFFKRQPSAVCSCVKGCFYPRGNNSRASITRFIIIMNYCPRELLPARNPVTREFFRAPLRGAGLGFRPRFRGPSAPDFASCHEHEIVGRHRGGL
jgi:hypothetical protein